jgi:hypothetical protein
MKRFVEGADRGQSTLFPECLEDWIGEDNPVRVIDVFVDELELGELGFEGVDPEMTGRPSYHPSVLLKLYIYGDLASRPVGPASSWAVASETRTRDSQSSTEAITAQPILVPPTVSVKKRMADVPTPPPSAILSKSNRQLLDGRNSIHQADDERIREELRRLRDDTILREIAGADPERCILRDRMIDKMIDARLDEPEDFHRW